MHLLVLFCQIIRMYKDRTTPKFKSRHALRYALLGTLIVLSLLHSTIMNVKLKLLKWATY